jgi:hypothetical protein
MGTPEFARFRVYLSAFLLLIAVFPIAAPAQNSTGRFEVYCNGVGIFLAKVDGAPAPRKVLLFLYTGFPGIPYVPKEEWKEVSVYRNGCRADGACDVLTRGKVRLDTEITPDGRRVSGKYEIEFSGQHLHGQFAAERRNYRHPPWICE